MEETQTTPEVNTEKTSKKRSPLYLVLISVLLVLLVGVLAGAGYWVYDTYMTTPDTAENVTATVTAKTAEEKELEAVSADLNKDDDLSTDDMQKEADDLNSIDVSGI